MDILKRIKRRINVKVGLRKVKEKVDRLTRRKSINRQ